MDESIGFYTVVDAQFDVTASDNCSYTLSNDLTSSTTLLGEELSEGLHAITWTATDASGNEVTCVVNITIDLVTDVATAIRQDIQIYPNPANEFVYVSISENTVYQITISDITGKVISNQIISSSMNRLDLSSFAKGIYIMNISNEQTNQSHRIVVE